MRMVCFDPLTIATIAGVGSALTTTASAVTSGATARAQAEAQEAAFRAQQQRDLRDIRETELADASRIRALLATQGGDATSAQTLLAANASTAARNRARVLQDSRIGVASAKANKAAGLTTIGTGILGGALGATSALFGRRQ